MVWFMLQFGKRILKALIKPPIYLQWTESDFLIFLSPHFDDFFTLNNINQRLTKTPEGKISSIISTTIRVVCLKQSSQ